MANANVADAITSEQIRQLQIEAGFAGDDETIRLCSLAIEGDKSARAECEAMINEARLLSEES
jgi:hypothetical protein